MTEPDLKTTAERMAPEAGTAQLPALRDLSKGSSRPVSGRRAWGWATGIALISVLGGMLYFQPWASPATPVVVEIAEMAPVTRVLAVNGRIAATHSVDVRPLVSGPLSEVLIDEGDVVPMGAVLARIEPATQQAILRQAVAGLDAALVAQTQAEAVLARTQALGANVPRTTLDDAASAVESAAQEVARTSALVDQAQIDLEKHTIRAPMGGTVLAVEVEPGQNVDPATVLLSIADLSGLVVETDVDETYATQIRPDMPAVLQLAGETRLRDGRVSFVSQRVDAGTGGLAVELAFDEDVTAPVGLTVAANIVVDRQDAALTIPRAAMATDADGTAVFIVEDGLATRRPVSVIDWPATRLIVTQGLSPGDAIITDATGLADGQAIRVEAP